MLIYNASVNIKQFRNRLLCQPNSTVLHTDFDSFLVSVFCEYEKVNCAITDLYLLIILLHILFLSFICFVFRPILIHVILILASWAAKHSAWSACHKEFGTFLAYPYGIVFVGQHKG